MADLQHLQRYVATELPNPNPNPKPNPNPSPKPNPKPNPSPLTPTPHQAGGHRATSACGRLAAREHGGRGGGGGGGEGGAR
eukprot:scaffold35597_cov19-Phaeocystis_antarctica.AAC.1